MNNKKDISISGTVELPLNVGEPAIIILGETYLRTSRVVEVMQISSDEIRFETLNSVYSVSPMISSIVCQTEVTAHG